MSANQTVKRVKQVSLLAGLVVLAVLIYFEARSVPKRVLEEQVQRSEQQTAEQRESRCAGLIENALVMLQPDALTISSDPDTAVSVLNQWVEKCEGGVPQLKPSPQEAWPKAAGLLPSDMFQRALSDRFRPEDGFHIRDALWCRQAIDFAAGPTHRDVDRAVSLFYYVVRNMDLVGLPVPVGPFDAMLLGKGSAAHRAWVFVELLRQLRLDAVVLVPGNEDPSSTTKLLVGVLARDGVYLFDPKVGLPIPSAADDGKTIYPTKPATLAEVRSHPELLRRLDISSQTPYWWQPEDLNEPKVLLVGDSVLWSVRMRLLQRMLTGENFAVVFDGLDDTLLGPGLFSRVVEFGKKTDGWKADQVGVWPFPEQQRQGQAHMTDAQKAAYRALQESLMVPTPLMQVQRTEDENGRPTLQMQFGAPEKIHLSKRIDQLLGKYADAIQGYLLIRLWKQMPPPRERMYVPDEVKPLIVQNIPERVQRPHRKAAEEAFYRIAVCQYELGDFPRAADTLKAFLDEYKQSDLLNSAKFLLASCYAALGQNDQAVATLKLIERDSPFRMAAIFLLRRWSKFAEAKKDRPAATENKQEKAATEKPSAKGDASE